MKFKHRLILISVLWLLILPNFSFAATAASRLGNVIANQPSYSQETTVNTLTDYVGGVVGVFLGLLGTIFTVLIIYAGYTWMMAGGNADKVSRADHTIKVAIIGLLIIVAAYAIWVFLLKRVVSI